jgi:hypothetical protein
VNEDLPWKGWTNSYRCAMLTLQISRVTQKVFRRSINVVGVLASRLDFFALFASWSEHFSREGRKGTNKRKADLKLKT